MISQCSGLGRKYYVAAAVRQQRLVEQPEAEDLQGESVLPRRAVNFTPSRKFVLSVSKCTIDL